MLCGPYAATSGTTDASDERLATRRRYSLGQGLAVVGVGAVTMVGGLSACGEGTSATPEDTNTPPAVTETETAEPEVKSEVQQKFDDAKAQYEIFVQGFNAEQQQRHAELSQDSLASMTDAEMVQAARIPLTEVVGENGEIDPVAYATSLTIRIGATENAGCSDATFEKYGGIDKMSGADVEAVTTSFTANIVSAIAGHEGTPDTAPLYRCLGVEGVRSRSASAAESIQPYEIITFLQPGTVNYDTATRDLAFSLSIYDNYDNEALASYVGSSPLTQSIRSETYVFSGVHVTEDGFVVPDHTGSN